MAAADILRISFEFSPKVGTRQLPALTEHYESVTRPGIYVAGDMADGPIIKVALNQGYEVVQRLWKKDFLERVPPRTDGDAAVGAVPTGDPKHPQRYDVVILGAGPAGMGAAIACQERGLTYVVLEKERPFNTIQNYPRAKHVFSEPRSVKVLPNVFQFDDALKEDLVDRWEKLLDQHAVALRQPEEVTDVQSDGEGFKVVATGPDGDTAYRARKVMLCIGRRGNINKLGCKGAELDKVEYVLHEPTRFRDRQVLVVGGGDSAVEAAIACAESGARVTVSYRQESFARAKAANRQKIERMVAAGVITVIYQSTVEDITETGVTLRTREGTRALANDYVLGFLGASLPTAFLKKLGVQMEGDLSVLRAAWITFFALVTYLFYCIKAHKEFFPFQPGGRLHGVYDTLQHLHIPWWGPHMVDDHVVTGTYVREVSGSFLGTCVYSALVLYFGLKAMKRYPSPLQKKRYRTLIFSQLVLLFAIPELIAPLFVLRPWKWYAVAVPWPLSKWSLLDGPTWAHDPVTFLGLSLWVWLGALASFVAVPLFVRYHGERFCAYLCGCGALAETFGDRWRHLAPRGRTAKQAEWFGRFVLLGTVVTTVFMLTDMYQGLRAFAWIHSHLEGTERVQAMVNEWYDLIVDFWLAAVVGVAAYPYLGNRFWCRFMCPLRAYMEIIARWAGRLKIVSNNKCIGCGQCTRYCQMGIDVQRFAQTQQDLANHNSACIQCGICIEVCPMDVLSLERSPRATRRALPIYGQTPVTHAAHPHA